MGSEAIADFAEMTGIELLVIDADTTIRAFGQRAAMERGVPSHHRGPLTMGILMLPELREQVWRANQAIVAAGLVTLSFGNASGVDRDAGVLLIKPSGVPVRRPPARATWSP